MSKKIAFNKVELLFNFVSCFSFVFGVGSQARIITSLTGASMTASSATRTSQGRTLNSSPGGRDVTPGSPALSGDLRSRSMTLSTATGMETSEHMRMEINKTLYSLNLNKQHNLNT